MAGVTVPVKDSASLDFSFVLAANVTGASASAQMGGWWIEPFGVNNLKIGPEVTLSIEIIYAQFVSTGTPRYEQSYLIVIDTMAYGGKVASASQVV